MCNHYVGNNFLLGVDTLAVKAYNGITVLTEEQLYNETNMYQVDPELFDVNGNFIPTTDDSDNSETSNSSDESGDNETTNKTQYNISYDMSTKYNCSVMDYAQITVLTHGLGSGAGIWSNNFSSTKTSDISFAYDSSSLIAK